MRTLHATTPIITAACLLALLSSPLAAQTAAPVAVGNANITEAEVLGAQKAWGEALVRIARDYEDGGHAKAKATAAAVIDGAYGYQFGPVLFKPTLTVAPQTFRTTREGALAYFVGGDTAFPADTGFALKGWRTVEVANSAILLQGDTAMTLGKVTMTDKHGNRTEVDKTWAYRKDDRGQLRIVVHHSSLPYTTAK
ncbi:MAG: hypothetical protein CFE45_04365 [Burkholderiales bacterium PBB5]|nr:MAG: hypothetical protein CFE45_04365 [Burkholderiales bacterium PBB5]